MAVAGQYNTKCTGVRRLMKEAQELSEPTEMFFAQPMEDNLFEWHFTVRGPLDSDFDGGIYHGKIFFPSDYPLKPPNMIILTPNGRFELNKKICLSISGYHPETWLPSWSIRTALLALIGFMPTKGAGAVGSLEYPPAERKKLALKSVNWTCKECGLCMKDALKPFTEGESASKSNAEAKELASKLQFQDESAVKAQAALAAVAGDPPATSSQVQELPVESEPEDSGETSASDRASSTPAPPPPAAAVPLSRTSTRRRLAQRESDCNYSLFVTIPLCIALFAVFCLLLARRLLM